MKNLLTYVIRRFTNIAHLFDERKPDVIYEKKIVAKEDFILEVPFPEKDKAKSLGARWNPEIKKWYVPKGKEVSNFEKWIYNSEDISKITLDPPLYLASAYQICWKCSQKHQVFCLSDGKTYFSFVKKVPKSLYLILKEKAPTYFYDYSKTVEYSYFINHCSNCKSKSGDFFLHQEEDSPFFLDTGYINSNKVELTKLDLGLEKRIEIEL